MAANIGISEGNLLINGVQTNEIAGALQTAGIAEAQIADILGLILIGASGSTAPPPFSFQTDVEQSVAACTPTYARQFQHADWQDGESRVQAGMTPEELGFNARFHGIESEFDAIAAQFQQLGQCVANLRLDLFGVVGELEQKITQLQNDIHELKQESGGGGGGGGGFTIPGTITQPPIATGGFGFIGTTRVGTDDFLILQDAGQYRLVQMQDVTVNPGTSGGLTGTIRESDIPVFVESVVDTVSTTPELADRVTAGTTVGELRETFGDSTVTLPAGGEAPLRDLLSGVADDTPIRSTADLSRTMLEHEGVTATEGVRATRDTLLVEGSRELTGATLADSGTEVLSGVDTATAGALSEAGFGRVGDLAGSSPEVVTRTVLERDATISETSVRNAISAATGVIALDGLRR